MGPVAGLPRAPVLKTKVRISPAACDAATLWADLATRMTRGRSAMRALWHGPLTHILREGPLARRLLDSAGRAPSCQRLAEVYRALCDCLDGGRQFSA